jgi:enolase
MNSTIVSVHGRRVWDSRGRPTVEAEIRLEGGAVGRAIAPAGASTGSGEARELRDGGPRLGGLDVTQAVTNVSGPIAKALIGHDIRDQASIDKALISLDGTPDKGRLGANALIAVSMAAAHAAAAADGVPLWTYLAEGAAPERMPLPQIQIVGGGAHAGRRIDIQDVLVVCPNAGSVAEALDRTAEIYRAAGQILAEKGRLAGVADEGGWWPAFATNEEALQTVVRAIETAGFSPGADAALALDVAASQFGSAGRYRLGLEGRVLDRDDLAELLLSWVEHYPIVSIEDPFAEDDVEGFRRFTAAVAGRVRVVGDDLLVTDAARIEEAAMSGLATSVLIKPNQAGTLSEAQAAFAAARRTGLAPIVSARSGETEDVTIAHLAVGWRADEIKVGSMARGERTAKWNELLRVEEALAT